MTHRVPPVDNDLYTISMTDHEMHVLESGLFWLCSCSMWTSSPTDLTPVGERCGHCWDDSFTRCTVCTHPMIPFSKQSASDIINYICRGPRHDATLHAQNVEALALGRVG